ncbi:MAG: ABC transporter ATP-binding protein [Desulfobacteraceae bacterium]|nr:ABC transporter ATP-binding protein [Desulfobacteraceae bacterium]
MFLEISGLSKHFGGLAAVSLFDIHVNQGETVGLIGPNGAGKTTVFNLITGFLRPTKGSVLFDGKDITGKKPHLIAKLGIGRAFQLVPLFADFTVLQNVVTSFHLRPKSSLWDAFLNTSTYRRNEEYILQRSLEILQLVGLNEVGNGLAKNLPHGYQKMLGMARALAVDPKLLLLDEPIGGMSPDEINFARTAIEKIQQQGVSILLIEHNMQIMDICNRVVVMNFGQKIAEGSLSEVRENKEVIQAYFGGEHAA